MKPFDLVCQEDEWGCGVACIASLLGASYREVYERIRDIKGESINSGKPGLEAFHIALALKDHMPVVQDWEDSEKFPKGTIVCIEGSEPYDGGHYMLMTPKGEWMDPWLNLGKTPRKAGLRKNYPKGTFFLYALVPKSG